MSAPFLIAVAEEPDSLFGLAPATLQVIWFALLGVLLAGYAVLDGFDLGVGMMHPFVARTDEERRLVLNSIGPVWDGNEVWLVTFGGALFAAFPEAYATVFSAFYDALFLVLFGLVLRAVSIEFRGKLPGRAWRRTWDAAFFLSSTLVTFLFGVAVGNVMRGIPLDERHDYTGGFLDLLDPFTLSAGTLAVALFAMHGSIFLHLKTEGELQQAVRPRIRLAYRIFLAAYLAASAAAFVARPEVVQPFVERPWMFALPVANGLAIALVGRYLASGRGRRAFLASSAAVVLFVGMIGASLFPNLVPSTVEPAKHGLTIANASSSPRTLGIMLVIAMLGMPCVLAYTSAVYWTFRGKVRLDSSSY